MIWVSLLDSYVYTLNRGLGFIPKDVCDRQPVQCTYWIVFLMMGMYLCSSSHTLPLNNCSVQWLTLTSWWDKWLSHKSGVSSCNGQVRRGIEMRERPSKSTVVAPLSLPIKIEYPGEWLPDGSQQWSQWVGGGGKQLRVRNCHVEDTESTDIDIIPQLQLKRLRVRDLK